jgi:hypothetical protein
VEAQSNQIYALSQTHELLYDFFAYFSNNLTDFGFYITTPLNYTPFVDRFKESVGGVEASFGILVEQTACIPPFVDESYLVQENLQYLLQQNSEI